VSKTVLVIGTGTIGEPLIGLLATLKKELGIDNVLFHKRTALRDETAKVRSLVSKGAQLVVTDLPQLGKFQTYGHHPKHILSNALVLADVIIDCTPAGNENKKTLYEPWAKSEKIFIAQGSEKGFGIPYAYGINDEALSKAGSQFVQVVSCNTHNIACLIDTFDSFHQDKNCVLSGDFVCIRRANDISQDIGYIAAPEVARHTNPAHGTHHALDVVDLYKTVGRDFKDILFSSALKINSQYMHVIRFNITLEGSRSYFHITDKIRKNKFIALTYRRTVNRVFSFGREHGFYGRIYNQTVLPMTSLNVRSGEDKTIVSGFCFTPQDGNSILSSVAATLHGLHGNEYLTYMAILDKMLFEEV